MRRCAGWGFRAAGREARGCRPLRRVSLWARRLREDGIVLKSLHPSTACYHANIYGQSVLRSTFAPGEMVQSSSTSGMCGGVPDYAHLFS